MARPTWRNHRSSPYLLDEYAAAGHRTAIGVAWRFRTELTTLLVILLGGWYLSAVITLAGVLAVTLPLFIAVLSGRPSRRFLVRRIWCVLSRHRLQKACYETRLHTRSGRLPLVLRIHPTEVGERAVIWCRAGICSGDFEAHTGEIAAACYAREARIERNRRWAQLVTIDIVRRDTLAPGNVIVSGLTLHSSGRPETPAA